MRSTYVASVSARSKYSECYDGAAESRMLKLRLWNVDSDTLSIYRCVKSFILQSVFDFNGCSIKFAGHKNTPESKFKLIFIVFYCYLIHYYSSVNLSLIIHVKVD